MPIEQVRIRGFEVCKGWEDKDVQLPVMATARSAGYDFYVAEDTTVPCFVIKPTLVPTGTKAYMKHGEVLQLYIRSSMPKRGLLLSNAVGVVDGDYYENLDNDGHIMFMFWNIGDAPVVLKKGERIGQGIFVPYLTADQPRSTGKRVGGFGSSGK